MKRLHFGNLILFLFRKLIKKKSYKSFIRIVGYGKYKGILYDEENGSILAAVFWNGKTCHLMPEDRKYVETNYNNYRRNKNLKKLLK